MKLQTKETKARKKVAPRKEPFGLDGSPAGAETGEGDADGVASFHSEAGPKVEA